MNLLRFNKEKKYIPLDYETCNLNLVLENIQAPWQLGWEVYKGESLLESHEDWIWWDDLNAKMGEEAARITGFDYYLYKSKAKPALPIWENVNKHINDPNSIIISANGINFDTYIHGIYAKLLGFKPDYSWAARHYDIQTVHKAKFLGYSIPPIGGDEWIFFNIKMSEIRQRGMKSSLKHLCETLGIPYDEERHHKNALYDVELTMHCFLKQIKTIDIYEQ